MKENCVNKSCISGVQLGLSPEGKNIEWGWRSHPASIEDVWEQGNEESIWTYNFSKFTHLNLLVAFWTESPYTYLFSMEWSDPYGKVIYLIHSFPVLEKKGASDNNF
jgi:hypothetical protein